MERNKAEAKRYYEAALKLDSKLEGAQKGLERFQSNMQQADIEFEYASSNEWLVIHTIANKTWPIVYGKMISNEQLMYMLELIYSESAIKTQMEVMKHEYILGLQEKKPFGFTSIQQHFKEPNQLIIHKLYVLPEYQGNGLGKAFLDYTTELAIKTNHDILCLKAFHKNARAIAFYQNMGFSINGEEKTDIGKGYEILDYIMTKKVGT